MRYCISDIHGEYDLFIRLLNKINFNKNDTLYILGDIIDKGEKAFDLLKYIFEQDNIKVILGNHEYELLKYYENISDKNYSKSEMLQMLNDRFNMNCDNTIFEIINKLNRCPLYIELEDCILTHSGVPTDENNIVRKNLEDFGIESFIYDRKFKNKEFIIQKSKCVIFGHTPTFYITNKPEIIKYARTAYYPGINIKDYFKIHIDMGTPITETMACICLDNLECYYVTKYK